MTGQLNLFDWIEPTTSSAIAAANKPIEQTEPELLVVDSVVRINCSGSNNGCDFFLWSTQYKKTISDKMLEQLLTKGKTGVLTFKNKDDKPYKAHLVLELPLEQGRVKLVFADTNTKDTKKTLAKS